MKVLLIRPHNKGNVNTRLPESLNKAQGIYPPLGISYVAAVLERADVDVSILDAQALNLTTSELEQQIRERKPDVVGVTAMTSTIHGALEAARFGKENGATVVMGGPHLCAYPEETLGLDYIDYGINGEGEFVMLDLVKALEGKGDVSGIRGLVYKRRGKAVVNPPAIVENLDDLPFPALHLLPMKLYDCVITEKPFTTMITSRGCPYRCGFCFKQPTDKVHRVRSAKSVVDEMELYVSRYGVKEIMFYDDTFTFSKEHAMGICDEIIRRGLKIKWEVPTRVNCINSELLVKLKKAGCIRLRYGVESGDPGILRLMRKGTNIEQIRRVFRMTHKVGIETFAYFIIGYASENANTIRRTINLAKDLNPDWVMFTVATPYPKTHLNELARESGLVDQDYWRDFIRGETSERLPYFVEDAERWVKVAYKEFYLRPRFILKKVWKLRSINILRKYIEGFKGIIMFEMGGS